MNRRTRRHGHIIADDLVEVGGLFENGFNLSRLSRATCRVVVTLIFWCSFTLSLPIAELNERLERVVGVFET